MAVLQFNQFTCVRDDRRLFEPVSFEVSPGDVWQVAGPNGAGKTTLLRAMSGLFDGYEGEFLWGHSPIKAAHYERSESLMYLGHHPGVKSALTAAENLQWFLGMRAVKSDIGQALASVGLAGYENTLCYQMSAGQQRRVALARMYLEPAPVWVLDEPFTAIDKQGVERIEAQINCHTAQGGSVVMTSHQPISCPGLKVLSLRAPRGHLQ